MNQKCNDIESLLKIIKSVYLLDDRLVDKVVYFILS